MFMMGGAASPDQEAVVAAVLAKGSHLVCDEVVTMTDFGRGWRTVTTKVQGLPVNIRSIAHDRYLSSGKPEGGVSHQKDAKGFEIFILLHLGNGLVSFRSTLHGRYLSAPDPASKPPSQLLKTKRFLRELEMFTLEHIMDERYALRTYHGKYVAITMPEGFSERVVLANREVAGEWEHFDIEIYKELDKKGPVGEAGSQADVL